MPVGLLQERSVLKLVARLQGIGGHGDHLSNIEPFPRCGHVAHRQHENEGLGKQRTDRPSPANILAIESHDVKAKQPMPRSVAWDAASCRSVWIQQATRKILLNTELLGPRERWKDAAATSAYHACTLVLGSSLSEPVSGLGVLGSMQRRSRNNSE